MAAPIDLDLLTPTEQHVYQELKRRELALMSPMEYGVYVSKMLRYDHVVYIDALVVAAQDGRLYKSGIGPRCVFVPDPDAPAEDKHSGRWVHPETGEHALFRISFSEPPRHGKSYHISEHLPAWFLTKYPDLWVHLASYEFEFAASWGEKARDKIEANPQLGVDIRQDARAKHYWQVKGHRGTMKCAGIGGPLTGTGRHLGIIDDYVKNGKEAMSETVRKGHVTWYISTWRNRREPHPARLLMEGDDTQPDIFCVDIIMATRWHQDDLTGWLRQNEDHRWYFVNLPALAFEDEQSNDYGDPKRCVLGRKPGMPLCPQRITKTDLLDELDSAEGRFWFNAQYQGIPKVEGGGIISGPFHYFQILPGDRPDSEVYHLDTGEQIQAWKCIRFATVDLAATMKTTSDYTVFAVWDVTPGPDRKLLLRAQFRLKVESAEHVKLVEGWAKRFSPKFVGIEDRTFGTTLIQNLRKRRTVKIRPLLADTDKVTRALGFGFLVGDGLVYLPTGAEWVMAWEDEMTSFPYGSHDDQVDVAAYAAVEFERIPKRIQSENEKFDDTLEARVQTLFKKKLRDKKRSKKRRVQSVRYR